MSRTNVKPAIKSLLDRLHNDLKLILDLAGDRGSDDAKELDPIKDFQLARQEFDLIIDVKGSYAHNYLKLGLNHFFLQVFGQFHNPKSASGDVSTTVKQSDTAEPALQDQDAIELLKINYEHLPNVISGLGMLSKEDIELLQQYLNDYPLLLLLLKHGDLLATENSETYRRNLKEIFQEEVVDLTKPATANSPLYTTISELFSKHRENLHDHYEPPFLDKKHLPKDPSAAICKLSLPCAIANHLADCVSTKIGKQTNILPRRATAREKNYISFLIAASMTLFYIGVFGLNTFSTVPYALFFAAATFFANYFVSRRLHKNLRWFPANPLSRSILATLFGMVFMFGILLTVGIMPPLLHGTAMMSAAGAFLIPPVLPLLAFTLAAPILLLIIAKGSFFISNYVNGEHTIQTILPPEVRSPRPAKTSPDDLAASSTRSPTKTPLLDGRRTNTPSKRSTPSEATPSLASNKRKLTTP